MYSTNDPSQNPPSPLAAQYQGVRTQTEALCEGLSAEDMLAQSMPDASPLKWHLAHTTWFFETFIAKQFDSQYREFHPDFSYLFNSYYESEGARHARPQRGLLTRPDLSTVWQYRKHVDQALMGLLRDAASRDSAANSPKLTDLLMTGLHHEMQHQELMLTDLLHLLSHNPLFPAVQPSVRNEVTGSNGHRNTRHQPPKMHEFEGGLIEIGAQPEGFYYDCEAPRHKVWLEAYKLAHRPVTNREWLAFMEDRGYHQPLLWLSDGWDCRRAQDWHSPLYWHELNGQWHQYGLDGLQPLDLDAAVCHISFYEADAFARWAGMRLPTEQEWEHAAASVNPQFDKAVFLESHQWRAQPPQQDEHSISDLFGNVWEWTQSPYVAYPGFAAEQGALGEYNGKFMANQWVLRGGSCATAQQQMRVSYRNFFHPHQRWQFSGLRLAQ